MEDVLRKIYLKKHQELQKRKLERKLNIEETNKRQKLYKNIFEDYLPLVQSFNLDNELNLKKEIHFGNDFLQQNHRYKIKSVASPFDMNKTTKFPPINRSMQQQILDEDLTQEELMLQVKNPERFNKRRKELETEKRRKFVTKRFRIRAMTILFVFRLSILRKQNLIKNRQKTQSVSQNLLQIIEKMVNKYYTQILEQQLLKYLQLIKFKIQQPKIMLEKQILNLLYFMSKQLAKSAIIKELMEFLMTVSQNGSFFPSDYLTQFEIVRLQFDPKYGCVKNVTQPQKKMIIAVCVGLKIFCGYILYRPWTLKMQKSPISPQSIINNYQSVIKLIHGAASIFYYIIFEEFCENVDLTPELKPSTLKRLNIGFQKYVNIFPKEYEGEIIDNPKEIFPNQKKKLFLTLMNENPSMFTEMRENIKIWIQRIYNACLKEEQKFYIQKRQKIKEQQKEIIRQILGKTKAPQTKNDKQEETIKQSRAKSVKDQNLSERIFNSKEFQSERNSRQQSTKRNSIRRYPD